MKCRPGDARLGERVGGELVGDLEALGLGVGGLLDARDGLGRHVDPGNAWWRRTASRRRVRRMQIDGISAIRSLDARVARRRA